MRSRIASLAGHLLVLGCALGGAFVSAFARADTAIPPPPVRYVTDRAAFLSTASAAELDARLADYSSQTGHQLLVYIDRTTGGIPIEDWAAKAFQNWKVGRQRIDDGLVLFVFSDDHRLRIEVGYGLEERVTDALASRIINDRMVPLIRAGDRDGAIRTGVDALEAAMGTAGTSPPPAAHVPVWQLVLGALALLFVLGFAVTHPGLASLMMMSIGSGRGGGGWGGGGGGSGGGGFSGGGGSSGGGGASGSW